MQKEKPTVQYRSEFVESERSLKIRYLHRKHAGRSCINVGTPLQGVRFRGAVLRTPGDGCPYGYILSLLITHLVGLFSMYSQTSL